MTHVRTRGRPATDPAKRKPGRVLKRPLTDAQRVFIARYLMHRNATRAYREAFPKASAASCYTLGSRMTKDVRISSEIKAGMARLIGRYNHSAAKALNELGRLAYANVLDFMAEDGTVKAPHEIEREVGAAIKKMRSEHIFATDVATGERKIVGRKTELEIHDKVAPLRLLGQHYGVLVEKVEVGDADEFAALLKAARERAYPTTAS